MKVNTKIRKKILQNARIYLKNKLKFSISKYFLSVLFILLSNGYAHGQENNKTITDIDGNVYNTVSIGTQTWMAENLRTTKYCNGDPIVTTTPSTLNISSESTPKYQWAYEGNESNVAIYGRLYTCCAATDSRGICPSGWHVPTDNEWTTLAKYLGGESVAGTKLKEEGTNHWKSPNYGATNSSGFTALPGGFRNLTGSFGIIGIFCGWWSSTECSTNYAWHRGVANDINSALSYYSNKTFGFSIRCVRN